MDLGAKPYKIFTRIAETLSFSRAAESLNMSQPALSAQLRELERQLGFALFNRTSRRVELSPEGALFLGNARRMVLEAEWAMNAAQDIRSKPLRIGVAHYSHLIPERIALTDGFMAAHPDMLVKIDARHPRQLAEDLDRGAIDVAITLQVEGATKESLIERLPAAFDCTIAGRITTGIAIPADHDLAGVETISPDRLSGQRLFTFSRVHGVAVVEAIIFAFNERGAVVEHAPEGDASSALRYAALRNAPCIDLGWFPFPQGSRLKRVAIDWQLGTSLSVFWIRRRTRPAVERFLAHCAGFAAGGQGIAGCDQSV